MWTPPGQTQLVAVSDAATTLRIARDHGKRLAASGLLGLIGVAGAAIYGDADALAGLAARRLLDPDGADLDLPAAVIVKVGPPARDETDDVRKWSGYHLQMPEATKLESITRWWPIANPYGALGKLLVVTVATIVVEVYKIVDTNSRPGGRVAFTVEMVSDHAAAPYRFNRIRPKAGPMVEKVNF